MPDLTITDIDAALYARLQSWAREQHKPLPALAREILAASDRAHEKYDPTMSDSTRWIRRNRDGGCGLCDELEPLFRKISKVG